MDYRRSNRTASLTPEAILGAIRQVGTTTARLLISADSSAGYPEDRSSAGWPQPGKGRCQCTTE